MDQFYDIDPSSLSHGQFISMHGLPALVGVPARLLPIPFTSLFRRSNAAPRPRCGDERPFASSVLASISAGFATIGDSQSPELPPLSAAIGDGLSVDAACFVRNPAYSVAGLSGCACYPRGSR